MKAVLRFEIECGEETCITAPYTPCPFLRVDTTAFNMACLLFGKLEDRGVGWIQRHPDCLKAAEKRGQ